MTRFEVVIVGGGHAGAAAAIALRQNAFDESIAIISDETDLPYDRPPLSKEYLAGDKSLDRLALRPASFWNEKEISVQLGASALSIDPDSKTVLLSSGSRIRYGKLIWAAGGKPRSLPNAISGAATTYSIRSRRSVDQISRRLDAGVKKVAIVGGGYIGLEVAATLRKRDLKVCVVEALPRVLARVTSPVVSTYFQELHESQGVEVRVNTQISRVLGDSSSTTGVQLIDGDIVPADLVVVGIGISPNIEPLREAGALVENGVVVNQYCQTSISDVFAVGDCAAHPSKYADGQLVRLESVQNAHDMAKTTAAVICGNTASYDAMPWFWSIQFDTRLQTAGLNIGHDQIVVRGEQGSGSFSVVYLRRSAVIAIDCVNAMKDFAQSRKLICSQVVVDPTRLADSTVPLIEIWNSKGS